MKRWFRVACVVPLIVGAGGAAAAPINIAGLTFTELSAAVTLTGASGTGTLADPIVLNETVTGLDVTLQIDGLTSFGNPDNLENDFGAVFTNVVILQKVVLNNTGQTWNFYDHELQSVLGVPSTDGDGLSFAQDASVVRPFTSDLFSDVDEITDVRDFVNFSNGTVLNGQTVTFTFAISQFGSDDPVYLRQRPNFRPGTVPEPASLALLGLGLLGLAVRRRRA